MRPIILVGLIFASLSATALSWASSSPCRSIQGEVTYDKLKSLIQRCKLESPSEVLAHLPMSYRSYFTLMRQSQSLQKDGVSPLFPRIILFGESARTLIGLTGDPSSTDEFSRMEIIEFRNNRFHPREILFPGANLSDEDQAVAAIPMRTRSVRFNDSPRICATCHGGEGANFHPLWDSYPFWRGAYGATGDTFAGASRADRSDYDAFTHKLRMRSPTHSRYAQLLFRGYGTSPYAPYRATRTQEYRDEDGNAYEPNGRLSALLTRLNALRISESLRQLLVRKSFRNRVRFIETLIGCSGTSEFRQRASWKLQESRIEQALRGEEADVLAHGFSGAIDEDNGVQWVTERTDAYYGDQPHYWGENLSTHSTDLAALAQWAGAAPETFSLVPRRKGLETPFGFYDGLGGSFDLRGMIAFELLIDLSREIPELISHLQRASYALINSSYRNDYWVGQGWAVSLFSENETITRSRQIEFCDILVQWE